MRNTPFPEESPDTLSADFSPLTRSPQTVPYAPTRGVTYESPDLVTSVQAAAHDNARLKNKVTEDWMIAHVEGIMESITFIMDHNPVATLSYLVLSLAPVTKMLDDISGLEAKRLMEIVLAHVSILSDPHWRSVVTHCAEQALLDVQNHNNLLSSIQSHYGAARGEAISRLKTGVNQQLISATQLS